MSKIANSPVSRWPGHVVLADPLSWDQYVAFSSAVREVQRLAKREDVTTEVIDRTAIAGILPCVEEWRLQGLPAGEGENRIPATPREASTALIGWLMKELTAIAFDEADIPKLPSAP
jgi:hypothetical protein